MEADVRRSTCATGTPPQPPFDIDADYKRYVDGKPRYEGVRSFLESRGIHLPYGEATDPPGDAHGLAPWATASRSSSSRRSTTARSSRSRLGAVGRAVEATQGFRLGVVSSSRNCGPVLRAAKIDHLFETRVDGLTLAELNLPGKPAPDAFLKAAREPRRDAGADASSSKTRSPACESGRAGNFGLVLGVDREGHADALRKHGADAIVRDLGEMLDAQ